MIKSITNSLFADYLSCNYKAYLKVNGRSGKQSEYEKLQINLTQKYHESIFHFLTSKWPNKKIAKCERLTKFIKNDFELGFNIKGRFDSFDVIFDGLIRDSKREIFPIIFIPNEKISITDKLQLAFSIYVLGKYFTKVPSYGRIFYGADFRNLRIKLDKLMPRVHSSVDSIKSFCTQNWNLQMGINSHCQICEFERECLKMAEENDDLSLLSGIDAKKISKLNAKGIFTIHQLSYTFRPRRRKKNQHRKANPFHPELKALALRDNKVYVIETPNLPDNDVEIYLDIEGIPNENLYYLIGLLINDNGCIKKFSFWADTKENQFDIFFNLMEIVNNYENYIIYHYGNYEKKYLKYMIKKLKGKKLEKTEKMVNRRCNILSLIYSKIYIPTHSNGLKEIAKYLGYTWAEKNASGIQSILWRKQWEKNRNSKIKNKLIQYNMDDCLALNLVKDFIHSIIKNGNNSEYKNSEMIYQHQLEKSLPFRFLVNEYANPAIETIHKYSFFDYQRQRVFVRTDDFIRLSEKNRIKKKRSVLRANKSKTFSARVCVYCKSRDIWIGQPISKRIIDLRFNDSGVKRWITKLSSNVYRCNDCNKSFSPKKYKIGTENFVPKGYRKHRTKYGHSLKCWVVYQHIVNHQSFRKIESNLYEFHKLAIDKSSLHEFKNYIQKYYNSTYKLLTDKILNSNVLYADETPLKMRNEDGYAWVFTNNKEVLSIYQPTREGNFLKEFLKNFKGILVSDFYAAYDSIDCTHQKCLIHLIRDMNDDLLKDPFNDEFKYITQNFTNLIQKIVKTIDRYGLKKRYLSKYRKNADLLFNRIEKKTFSTDIAIYYQERLSRNRERLFQFINHNNVSWNNNNAEKAIKFLATHTNRKIKLFTSERMKDYLKIMSIYQTCVYNDVSFMKFLLSKERDFDRFFECYF
jgi:predicted RecB family nuclease